MLKIDENADTAHLTAFPNTAGNSINAIGYRLQDKLLYGSIAGGKLIRIDGTGKGEILATINSLSYAGDVTPDGKRLVFANLYLRVPYS